MPMLLLETRVSKCKARTTEALEELIFQRRRLKLLFKFIFVQSQDEACWLCTLLEECESFLALCWLDQGSTVPVLQQEHSLAINS